MLFRDRTEAGRTLARHLGRYAKRTDVVVLALPRGGVPVGYEVARALEAPLDVFIVRKLGLPGQEELAMGAIASGGVRVLNDELVRILQVPPAVLDTVAGLEQKELERRERLDRNGRAAADVRGRTAILVDDGLATGSSMLAAVEALRRMGPARIVVAVPVASAETCEQFREKVDECVCAATPTPFYGVGMWYGDFSQTGDDEVQWVLDRAAREMARDARPGPGAAG
jgi:predicted phosphoribosyltransferase